MELRRRVVTACKVFPNEVLTPAYGEGRVGRTTALGWQNPFATVSEARFNQFAVSAEQISAAHLLGWQNPFATVSGARFSQFAVSAEQITAAHFITSGTYVG